MVTQSGKSGITSRRTKVEFSQSVIHSSSEEWLTFRSNTNIAVAGAVKNVRFFQLCTTAMTFYTCLVLISCRFKVIQHIPLHASTFPLGCHQSPLLITLLHQYLSVWSLRKFIFSTLAIAFRVSNFQPVNSISQAHTECFNVHDVTWKPQTRQIKSDPQKFRDFSIQILWSVIFMYKKKLLQSL